MRCPKCDSEMTSAPKVVKDKKTGELKERCTRDDCTNPHCRYHIG